MKTILSSFLALAFMLPTALSHAFNPLGAITVHNFTRTSGVAGYTLVAQCRTNSRAGDRCYAALRTSTASTLQNHLAATKEAIERYTIHDDPLSRHYISPSRLFPRIIPNLDKALRKNRRRFSQCMAKC